MAARPEVMKPKPWKSTEGNTPLHYSCHEGDYNATLMLLLAHPEMIHARNDDLETPLHRCSSLGHLEVMMLLLDAQADVNTYDNDYLTPLHLALIHGNRNATELLLAYNAHIYGPLSEEEMRKKEEEDGTGAMSPLEFSNYVTVCHDLVKEAQGRVWSLQHFCRLAIRKYVGISRRRRIKELPLPRHLISFVTSLPVSCSDVLHSNWERTRSTKCQAVKDKQESRRPKKGRVNKLAVLQTLKGDNSM